MPLSELSVVANIRFSLEAAVTGWPSRTQGQNVFALTATGVDLTKWDQAGGFVLTVTSGADAEIDLADLTNFVCEEFALGAVLAIGIQATGGDVLFGPAAVDGWPGFFGDLTDRIKVRDGEGFIHVGNPSGDGYPVTDGKLAIEWVAGTTVTVTVVVVGASEEA